MWRRCRFAKLDALQKSAFENKRTPPLRGAVGTFTSPMSFLITTWVSHSCHSQNLLTSKKTLPAAMAEWKYGIREMKQMLLTGLFCSAPRLVQQSRCCSLSDQKAKEDGVWACMCWWSSLPSSPSQLNEMLVDSDNMMDNMMDVFEAALCPTETGGNISWVSLKWNEGSTVPQSQCILQLNQNRRQQTEAVEK